MREKAISPLRQRMIEDMRSVRKSDDQSGSRYIHWQNLHDGVRSQMRPSS
jgi:hypothetical protein